MDTLAGFVAAGFALAGSPGPSTLSLAAVGAAFGVARGFRYATGLVVGMVAVMAIGAIGDVGLLLAIPGVGRVIAMLAAVYLLWLAWRIARSPPLPAHGANHTPPGFTDGIILSLVNPKAYAAMAALLTGFILVSDRPSLDLFFKVSVLTPMIAGINVVWLIAGTALTRFLRSPRASRVINVAFAILLVVSVGFAWEI